MTEVDNRTMTDCNSCPLDLSLKSSKVNDSNEPSHLTESLKQLIRLQTKLNCPRKEVLMNTAQSLTNPDTTNTPLEADNCFMNSTNWLGLCQSSFVMNQMLAKIGGLGSCSNLNIPPSDLSLNGLKPQFNSNTLLGKKKFSPGRFKCDSFMHTVAPPEAFGISMRGNQKYSAYYQRPFVFPFSSSAKQGLSQTTSLKKSLPAEKKSINSNNKSFSSNISVKETAFKCSCGEEFENLYIFTLHMKESNHSPKSENTERDIPKLVRGQDMWINSEIEQTREILRCMHCQQSFRTLPDLTMHMIKTNHFSEIVYSDSGRCVFLNSDQNSKSHDNLRAGEKRSSQQLKAFSPTIKNSHKSCSLRPKKMPRLRMEEPIEKTLNREDIQSKTPEAEEACSSIYSDVINESQHCIESTSSVKPDSSSKEYISEKSDPNVSSSVITQIENFVEKSLPKSTPKYKTNSSKVLDANKNNLISNPKSSHTTEKIENRSYIAPEEDNKTGESPLSSLQKLVDTTNKTNIVSVQRKSPFPQSSSSEKEDIYPSKTSNGPESSSSCDPERSTSLLANNIPPFMMFNSLYQPELLNKELISSIYSLYPSLTHSIPQEILQRVKPQFSIPDSPPQLHMEASRSSPEKGQNSSQSVDTSPRDSNKLSVRSTAVTSSSHSTPLTQVKKSKCNYCGKPFANKGQVRLHVSKGKCPSLMQSCHSTSLASAMLSANPFSYLSLGRS